MASNVSSFRTGGIFGHGEFVTSQQQIKKDARALNATRQNDENFISCPIPISFTCKSRPIRQKMFPIIRQAFNIPLIHTLNMHALISCTTCLSTLCTLRSKSKTHQKFINSKISSSERIFYPIIRFFSYSKHFLYKDKKNQNNTFFTKTQSSSAQNKFLHKIIFNSNKIQQLQNIHFSRNITNKTTNNSEDFLVAKAEKCFISDTNLQDNKPIRIFPLN